MNTSIDLLARPTYGMNQVDRLLALKPGTAKRWIDGYERGGKVYDPVVRVERTHDDVATWGEFVETRLLANYREQGIHLFKLRPTISRLRKEFGTKYPLAHAQPFLVDGRELVRRVQESMGLDRNLHFVEVAHNGQLMLTDPARSFAEAADFGSEGVVQRLKPQPGNDLVFTDPLRQFGEPVVRSVPTEVIAEQMRAGDSLTSIAAMFELSLDQIGAAVRYELWRSNAAEAA